MSVAPTRTDSSAQPMLSLLNELTLAARRLAHRPSYMLAVITTLAVGIGVNTAVFSVVRGVLLRPLPYADASRLVVLTTTSQLSIPDGNDIRQRSRTLGAVALFLPKWDFDLLGAGEPLRLSGSVVEPQLFAMLGLRALRGRALEPGDNRPGAPEVAVLANRTWHQLFADDPHIIGRVVTLNDHPTTIVGVMPDAADVLENEVQLWVPVASETPWALGQRGTNNFAAIARLRPGATVAGARRELAQISQDLTTAYPQTNTGKTAVPVSLLAALVHDARVPLLVLEAAVILVLLLATANLTGLVVVRAAARSPELTLRVALGARARELVRLFASEGAVLAAVGGALGIALALVSEDLLLGILPAGLPRAQQIHIDWPVAGVAIILAILCGAVLAGVPSLQTVAVLRHRWSGSAHGHSASVQHRRLLTSLVVAEVALAVVVLSASALLGRTFLALEHVQLGFDPTHVVTAELVLPQARYGDIPSQTRTITGVVGRIAAAPGVEAAASIIGLPFVTGHIGHRLRVEGRPAPAPGAEPSADSRPIVGPYFGAMHIPIVAGRAFTSEDNAQGRPVAVVNQTLARQLWPDRSPIGARVMWVGADSAVWMTVVGVAGDTRSTDLTAGDNAAVYTPYVQRTEAWQRWSSLVVRGTVSESELARAMRDAAAAIDPLVPLGPVRAVSQLRSAATAQQRIDAILLGAFATAALLIAVQGLYGTLGYIIEQRRREMGIRLAVGATPARVRSIVMSDGLRATAIGAGLGLIGAVLIARLAQSVLFGVSPTDPTTYLAVVLVIVLAAVAGSFMPALRAGRQDAIEVLRTEA